MFLFMFQAFFYCKTRGASIGCCAKQCRKSFHFSCGLKHKCLSEFIGNFYSYCHVHHATNTFNTSKVHEPEEPCDLCKQPMQNHNPVTSIQLICCETDKWYHKRCLKEQSFSLEDDFKCPSCGDVDTFRENMLLNGIFIPQSSSVAQYNSFQENSEVVQSEPPQKRRRVHKDWIELFPIRRKLKNS